MFEFRLPDVGEGVAEGEVLAWHVEPGETVAEDQVLAEVETDKAVVDVPSPVAGTVAERHAAVGDVVPVGDVLVTIDTDGEGAEVAEPEANQPAGAEGEGGEPAPDAGGGVPPVPDDRVFAPPHVRRLAREHGLDLTTISGSGPGGRITDRDVREAGGTTGAGDDDVAAAVSSVGEGDGDTAPAPEPTAAGGEAGQAPPRTRESVARETTLAVPATRKLARDLDVDLDAVPTDRTRDGEPFVGPEEVRAFAEKRGGTDVPAGEPTAGEGERPAGAPTPPAGGQPAAVPGHREDYRGVRRTIGEQMAESKFTAPHVTHHDSVEVSALVEARERLGERAADRGISLTYTPFVLKAVAAGLQEFPVLNSSLDEDAEEIVYHDAYNIGVATATDAGLMVPVVRDVDEKGLLQVASEVRELTARARDRSISREEMQGGTFSVTNVGAIGGEYATPIINHPETAILALGAIEERPWVIDGEVVARPVLPLSLSIDHRVIDGAEAARFTNTVMDYLSTPSLLLLE